jgi:hypothetical protein
MKYNYEKEPDRKKFITMIGELRMIKEAEYNLNKAFKIFEPDFTFISFGRYETLVVRALEYAFKDKDGWISYFIYDLEFGKKWHKGSVTDKNGKDIQLKNANDLYNLNMSPDISKCLNKDCPKKDTCYHYTVKPNEMQCYFLGVNPSDDGECAYFWETNSSN